MRKLLVAGGGTGGHVMAGLSVAEAWKRRFGAEASVLYVGARGGTEEKVVPRAGIPLRVLRLGSLNRVSLSRRLQTLAQLPLSFLASAGILLGYRPQAVLGVGGYASGPMVLTARMIGWLWGCRTAILEQNSVPGMTNRILGRVVHRVFTCFEATTAAFGTGKAVATGNPTRGVMQSLPSASADPFTVFIFGGSQGAIGMNTIVIEALPHLVDLKKHLRFVHQTGEKDFERVRDAHERAGTGARVEKFIHDMVSVYRESALLICRAGSSTLSEIAAVGRAALLVPLPTAADNHQEKNARIFSEAGAALLVPQGTTTGAGLAGMIRELLADPARLRDMERRAAAFHRPGADDAVVEGILAPRRS